MSNQHASAEQALGTAGIVKRGADAAESRTANRIWWDADADDYHDTHGDFLGAADFVWCPEGVREEEVRFLGEVAGQSVLEVGAGSAPCARWLKANKADVVALDISEGMLRHARAGNRISLSVG